MEVVTAVLVCFRFHGDLEYFLTPSRRNEIFEHAAGATDTVTHVIESLGVPHVEIGRIEIDNREVPSSYRLNGGDFVEVFPFAIPVRLKNLRFVLDGHLGRLAAHLRMLGFDTWYDRFADDRLLAMVARSEERCLLTRDVGLLKRRDVEEGYCVRSDKPHDQLREISVRFALQSHFHPFLRCMDCNGTLCPVAKQEIADLLPPHTRETKNEFSQCLSCAKIFWRGSHHARMLGWINDLIASSC